MKDFRDKVESVVDQEAAAWVIRQNRGLTSSEKDAFQRWLEGDPSRAAALAEFRDGWARFNRLAALRGLDGTAPDPDLFRSAQQPWTRRLVFAFAAAAALAIGIYAWRSHLQALPSPEAPYDERVLADGSVVKLNRGAALEVLFTPAERRVRLLRGEAQFAVAKDAIHPFFVDAAGVEVRAVGTTFDIRFNKMTVEVLVTEGKVKVATPEESVLSDSTPGVARIITAGQRAVVPLASPGDRRIPPTPQIAAVTAREIDEWLAWQPRLLDFTDERLSTIAAQLNRNNPVHLIITDPELGEMRLSASLRSDNVEGLVRLLESHFAVRAQHRGAEIRLSSTKQ